MNPPEDSAPEGNAMDEVIRLTDVVEEGNASESEDFEDNLADLFDASDEEASGSMDDVIRLIDVIEEGPELTPSGTPDIVLSEDLAVEEPGEVDMADDVSGGDVDLGGLDDLLEDMGEGDALTEGTEMFPEDEVDGPLARELDDMEFGGNEDDFSDRNFDRDLEGDLSDDLAAPETAETFADESFGSETESREAFAEDDDPLAEPLAQLSEEDDLEIEDEDPLAIDDLDQLLKDLESDEEFVSARDSAQHEEAASPAEETGTGHATEDGDYEDRPANEVLDPDALVDQFFSDREPEHAETAPDSDETPEDFMAAALQLPDEDAGHDSPLGGNDFSNLFDEKAEADDGESAPDFSLEMPEADDLNELEEVDESFFEDEETLAESSDASQSDAIALEDEFFSDEIPDEAARARDDFTSGDLSFGENFSDDTSLVPEDGEEPASDEATDLSFDPVQLPSEVPHFDTTAVPDIPVGLSPWREPEPEPENLVDELMADEPEEDRIPTTAEAPSASQSDASRLADEFNLDELLRAVEEPGMSPDGEAARSNDMHQVMEALERHLSTQQKRIDSLYEESLGERLATLEETMGDAAQDSLQEITQRVSLLDDKLAAVEQSLARAEDPERQASALAGVLAEDENLAANLAASLEQRIAETLAERLSESLTGRIEEAVLPRLEAALDAAIEARTQGLPEAVAGTLRAEVLDQVRQLVPNEAARIIRNEIDALSDEMDDG